MTNYLPNSLWKFLFISSRISIQRSGSFSHTIMQAISRFEVLRRPWRYWATVAAEVRNRLATWGVDSSCTSWNFFRYSSLFSFSLDMFEDYPTLMENVNEVSRWHPDKTADLDFCHWGEKNIISVIIATDWHNSPMTRKAEPAWLNIPFQLCGSSCGIFIPQLDFLSEIFLQTEKMIVF